MQLIPTPKKIEFNKINDNHGQFVIEPLYPGYGITIGNALRRVLFSSMPGAAIVSVKIKDVDHEFSTLPYIKEDIVDILLNIKLINLRIEGEIPEGEPLILKLNKTGEGKITAGDIDCPTQVTIANKNQHIATLTDKAASFEAEFLVEKGMGYLPTENRGKEKLDIGYIAVDAIFTPIEAAAMTTEHVRVGEMTNWDKLVLDITTNGTISCEEAFNLAVGILVGQFSALKYEETKKEMPQDNLVEGKVSTDNTQPELAETGTGGEEELVAEIESTEESSKKRGRPKKE